MEHNRRAVDAVGAVLKSVRSSTLDLSLKRQIGGILNAIELQVEEGKAKQNVVTLLFAAATELVKTNEGIGMESLREALERCARIVVADDQT